MDKLLTIKNYGQLVALRKPAFIASSSVQKYRSPFEKSILTLL